MCSIHINRLSLHNNTMEKVLLLSPCYRGEALPKVAPIRCKAKFKCKQCGSSLYGFLLLPLDCRQREEMKGKGKQEERKDRVFFPPMFFSVFLVSKAVSILDPLRPTGHGVRGVSHSTPRVLISMAAPVQLPGRD